MSGGFFRGTSADQDTRFSNKQAKLLKTQKFPSELDQLVDITKVKMDVMRPWIATRVTELLGFEDEVLINFIYGLLEGKVVDGKQIQIQLTGFMEKSTGKFMKELWNLLLSAQKNASGVPQQLLDSKEEEMRKKKAETDKLALEIQKRKERGGWGPEVDRGSRMDAKAQDDSSKAANARADSSARHLAGDDLDIDDKDLPDGRHNSRRKIRSSGSPYSAEDSQSPPRRTLLAHRSRSRSISNSRSYSAESHKSRSLSISPQRRRHSVSRDRHFLSRRHPISPRRPRPSMRWHSPRSKRRSTSRSHHRSPSLPHRRSPIRRRSRSPMRHRSRSPLRYRYASPRYHRSRSPSRRKSPIFSRRRSPSPLRHRSPVRHRPSLRHASPSPHPLSPKRRRSPLLSTRRSYSPQKNGSPKCRSPRSPGRNIADPANRMGLKRAREDDSILLARHLSEREVKQADFGRKREDHVAQTSAASQSPQRNGRNRYDSRNSVIVKSHSEKAVSPVNGREKKSRHTRPSRKQNIMADISEGIRTRGGNESRHARERNSNKADDSRQRTRYPTGDSDSKVYKDLSDVGSLSPDVRGTPHRIYGKNKAKIFSSPSPGRGQEITSLPEEVEYGPGRVEDDIALAGFSNKDWESTRGCASLHGRQKGYEHSPVKNSSIKDNDMFAEKSELYKDDECSPPRKWKKVERNDLDENFDTYSEDDKKYKSHTIERRMSKVDDKDSLREEAEYDSQLDHLKERKHRHKDEKKLRKEEKRRRRDERHHPKEERCASKQKAKYLDIGTPSDHEQNCDAAFLSDDGTQMDSKLDDNKETEMEQKKLEIQLREKALESLRAKKAITN